ncbi:GH3 auxin-responsive promoter family protein [Lachnospiraceae bacterium NSJ-143]|nr:GH3 auxin-responsive promoter family protein [Lachnospiraceae bacterium NSJ-143]
MDKTQLIIQKNIEKGRTGLKRLEEASKNGFEENRKLLLKIIEENKNTQYGKKYGFEYIKTIEDYIKKVPVTEYKDYEEYIAGIERGEKNVLSARETIHFALSSGSSGTPKKVPMCQEAADLFAMYTHGACFAAMDRELGDNWKKGRGVSLTEIRFSTGQNGFTYGAVSGKVREKNKAYESDIYTSPLSVSYPECDMDFMYLHLRFALVEKNLSFITCTFMTAVYDTMRYLETNWQTLVNDIERGTISDSINMPASVRNELLEAISPAPERARFIEREFKKGFEGIMPRIWPDLAFVFGIGSESFRIYTDRLRFFLGGVRVHYSVFSASEGIFACPIKSESDEMVLIPFSAFYEFRDINSESAGTVTMDKVQKGRRYELIVTNLSGFYRYRMMDVVEVVDFYNGLPVIKFLYRLNQVLNIAGEKTNDSTMKLVIKNFEKKTGIRFKEYTLYADTNSSPGRYIVFAEYENEISAFQAEGISVIIEECLCEMNGSYAAKIRAGKLKPLVFVPLKKGAYADYIEMMKKKGVSVNQLKPVRVADSHEKAEFFIKRTTEHGRGLILKA